MYSKDVFVPEYLTSINFICKELIKEQSATKLKALREGLLKLIVNGVPSDVIITQLTKALCQTVKNDDVKREVINWASFYDNRCQNGSKALFHLEALIARLMLIVSENYKFIK